MHSLTSDQLSQITRQLYSQLPGVPPAPAPTSNPLGGNSLHPALGFESPGAFPSPTAVSSPAGPVPGHFPSPLQTPPHPQQIPTLPSGVNQFTPTASHPAPGYPALGNATFGHPTGHPTYGNPVHGISNLGQLGLPAQWPAGSGDRAFSHPPIGYPTTGHPTSGSHPFSHGGTGNPNQFPSMEPVGQTGSFAGPFSALQPTDPVPFLMQTLSAAAKRVSDRESTHSNPQSLPWNSGTLSSPAQSTHSLQQHPRITTGSGGEGLRNFVSMTQGTHLGSTGLSAGTRSHGDGAHRLFGGHSPLPQRSRNFDVAAIRADFPILHQEIHGKPLVWLDNAATTQKPQCVIDAIANFYARDNSNIHRAAHSLAARATDAYEGARQKVQQFLGASSPSEIVFVRGTTEGINLIAQTCGRKFLQPGDEILLTTLEHHANIVPWQLVAKETGAVIRVAPINDAGEIILEEYERLLGPRTRLAAFPHANNSLGTLLPVETLTKMAKRHGVRVLIDGAQSVAHIPVNVQDLDCDFYVFSGHKIFGPTGIGAVYAKSELMEIMPPWQGGGSMIKDVTFEETVYSDPPAKFEAGTPNIADAVGLGAALDYVTQLGLPAIAKYEHYLLEYATERMKSINGLRLIGNARHKVGVLSFVLKDRETSEIGRLLDAEGIAVRSGHHCAQPSLRRMGVETTVRPSLSIYNTTEEIDHLVKSLKRISQRSPARF